MTLQSGYGALGDHPELIERYRVWQQALRDWGDTQASADAFYRVSELIEENPFLDVAGFEAVLDWIHVRAYPDASKRPARLQASERVSILE